MSGRLFVSQLLSFTLLPELNVLDDTTPLFTRNDFHDMKDGIKSKTMSGRDSLIRKCVVGGLYFPS